MLEESWSIDLRNREDYCPDCEAKSHYAKLQQIQSDDENIEKIRNALCFILENFEWEVKEG